MDFKEISNPWSEFVLPDGRKMRCRHILMDVIQTGTDPDGVPIYHLSFSAMIHIEPTEQQKSEITEQSRAAQSSDNPPKGTSWQ